MVFRGKPSRACLRCRKRRIRCDLKPNSCGQCTRASAVCSGYRDTTQLRIWDESGSVQRKALQCPPLPKPIDISIYDRARDAFFFNYLCRFSQPDDIPGLLWMQSSDDEHLSASTRAASLAFFSFQNNCTEARLLAREQYLVALPRVNRALQSSEQASSNSTFLAVILLDLFEKTMHDESKLGDTLMSHLNGALALVKLRGPENLHEQIGLRLSSCLSIHILMSCVSANKRIPKELIPLRSELELFIDKDEPRWKSTGLIIKYNHLRCDVQEGIIPVSAIPGRIWDLDREFRELAESMLPALGYRTMTVPKQCALFDVYPHHAATQIWNVFRVIRILLHDLQYKQALKDDPVPEFHDDLSSSRLQTVGKLVKEICGTVYQYTHKHDGSKMTHFLDFERARCYTLIFPLYVAATHAERSTGIRSWVMKQLSFLSSTVGIRQAKQVEEILARGDDPDPWSIYALLGSYAFAMWR